MNYEELEKKLKDSSQSYVRNEEPYKTFMEEKSGFISGVEWTLKKLNKLDLLKTD